MFSSWLRNQKKSINYLTLGKKNLVKYYKSSTSNGVSVYSSNLITKRKNLVSFFQRKDYRNCTNGAIEKDEEHISTASLVHPSYNTDGIKTLRINQKLYENIPFPSNWDIKLKEFQERFHLHRFNNLLLLKSAFIHHSYINNTIENKNIIISNRRLEFLGDSILGSCVASYVYQKYPFDNEGKLTYIKSLLVKNDILNKIALEKLSIMDLLLVNLYNTDISNEKLNEKLNHTEDDYKKKSMIKNGMKTCYAGCVEAIIGAIYIDQGYEKAIDFIQKYILKQAIIMSKQINETNPCIEFQEFAHILTKQNPEYRKCNNTADHSDTKVIELWLNNEFYGKGVAESFKKAKIHAAKEGLNKIMKNRILLDTIKRKMEIIN